MDTAELQQRIERFRREYLDTAEGREMMQIKIEEPKEVQRIYQELRAKQQAGEDITEATLLRLLPHLDTQGNRDRGARISTWPCITKDVKAWFEGANWKQPSEWPDAAKWILEIVEAGRLENWDRWRQLAKQPMQKGFACGFITPIVHCLTPRLPVINSKVVKTYNEVAHALGMRDEISSGLESYPENQRRLVGLVERLQAFGITGLREWDTYCHWNVTKTLGGTVIDNGLRPVIVTKTEMSRRLREAQHDTQNPHLFESAVADAFRLLGFHADHVGGSGETDVVIYAQLGQDGFSGVVDTKTSQPGASRQIHYDSIKGHQERHEADLALVVAPKFAAGNTFEHAKSWGVGLLTTDHLIELVEVGERFGISLYLLKEVLSQVGEVDTRMAEWRRRRADLTDAVREVLQLFEVHQRTEEAGTPLPSNSVYWLSKGQGGKFTEHQIGTAIEFLANPVVGLLEQEGDGYVLTAPARLASIRLSSIAREMASPERPIPTG